MDQSSSQAKIPFDTIEIPRKPEVLSPCHEETHQRNTFIQSTKFNATS